MSKQSAKEARERTVAEVATRNKLMKEFNETRDPIFTYIYRELQKTRKWVAFIGVVLILSLIGTIIILMGSAALAL